MAKPIKITILGDSSSVENALGRTQSGLEGLGSKVGDFAMTAAKRVAQAGAAIGAAALFLGVKTAAGMEQAEIGFTTLLGSGEKAKAFLNDLADFAAKTPFELPQLQSAAMKLTSVGIEASRVIPIMTVLGDATAAMGTGGEGVERATMALQQMATKGKVSGEEMLQLAEAGVPAWDALAASLGVTTAAAQDMVSKGKVSVEQLLDAIQNRAGDSLKRVSGMMDAQSRSLSGLWSTLTDTVSVGLAKAVAPIIPLLKNGLSGAISGLEPILKGIEQGLGWLVARIPDVVKWVREMGASVREALDNPVVHSALSMLTDGIQRLTATLWPLVSGALSVLWNIVKALAPVLGAVLVGAFWAVSAAVDALSVAVKWVVDHFSTIAKVLGVVLAIIGPALIPSVILATSVMVQWGLMSARAGAQNVAAWVASKVEAITSAAAQVAAGYRVVGSWLLMGAQAVAQGVRMAAVWTAQVVASAVSGAASFAVQVGRVVAGWVLMGAQSLLQAARMAAAWVIAMGPVGWVIAAVVGLVALIVANWDTVVAWTKAAWDAVVGAVKAAWNWITGAIGAAVDWIVGLFMRWTLPGLIISHWETIKSVFLGGVNAVIGFVSSLPGRIVGFFGDAASWLVNAGRSLLEGLWHGIQNAAGWLWDKVKGFAKGLVDNVLGFFGIHSPSRVFAGIGGQLMAGLAQGIDRTAQTAIDAASKAAGAVSAAASLPGSVALAGAPGLVQTAPGASGSSSALTRQDGAATAAGDSYVVNVNVQGTKASPREVGDEVVWALKTSGR